jgi:hypothetical protein
LGNAVGGSNPLPVELKSFNAYRNGNEIVLEWSTASELNNDYFTVQRSKDGLEFSSLLDVPGNGTSSEEHLYSAVDDRPFIGTSYYRLKQTDYNGLFSFSKVISVGLNNTASILFDIFPNPSNGANTYVKILGIDNSVEIQISIRDLLGRNLILIESHSGENLERLIPLQIDHLPPGVYLINLASKSGVISKRLVINNSLDR